MPRNLPPCSRSARTTAWPTSLCARRPTSGRASWCAAVCCWPSAGMFTWAAGQIGSGAAARAGGSGPMAACLPHLGTGADRAATYHHPAWLPSRAGEQQDVWRRCGMAGSLCTLLSVLVRQHVLSAPPRRVPCLLLNCSPPCSLHPCLFMRRAVPPAPPPETCPAPHLPTRQRSSTCPARATSRGTRSGQCCASWSGRCASADGPPRGRQPAADFVGHA